MKLKPGLGASHTIRPGNRVDLFYNSQTHTGQSIRMTEDRDKWRKYVHGVANPRTEDRMNALLYIRLFAVFKVCKFEVNFDDCESHSVVKTK